MRNTALPMLIKAHATHRGDPNLEYLSKKMFDMYTAGGFPPDMFIDRMKVAWGLTDLEIVYVVSIYQTLFLEHRRKSGINDKRIDAIRRRNREDIERLIDTGELGIY